MVLALSSILFIREPEEQPPISEREYIEQELKDYPALKEICRCESGLRHTNDKGNLIVGIINPNDRGVCQINYPSHKEKLTEMKLDPDKLEDNLKFAKYLYDTEGKIPWRCSQSCWSEALKKLGI